MTRMILGGLGLLLLASAGNARAENQCEPFICGGNSPIVGGLPLGALDVNGTPNQDEIAIVGFEDSTSGELFQLDVLQGELVARALDSGDVVLTGAQVVGLEILLDTPSGLAYVHIDHYYEAGIDSWAPGLPAVPGYDLSYSLPSTDIVNEALCRPPANGSPSDTIALLIRGETYDAKANRGHVGRERRPMAERAQAGRAHAGRGRVPSAPLRRLCAARAPRVDHLSSRALSPAAEMWRAWRPCRTGGARREAALRAARGVVPLSVQGVYGAVWLGDGAGLDKSDAASLEGLGVRATYGITPMIAVEGELIGASTGEAQFGDVTYDGMQGDLTRSASLGRVQFGGVLRLGGGPYVPLLRLGVGLQGASHRGTLTTATGEAPGPESFELESILSLAMGLDIRLGDSFIAGASLSAMFLGGFDQVQSIEAGLHLGYAWKP